MKTGFYIWLISSIIFSLNGCAAYRVYTGDKYAEAAKNSWTAAVVYLHPGIKIHSIDDNLGPFPSFGNNSCHIYLSSGIHRFSISYNTSFKGMTSGRTYYRRTVRPASGKFYLEEDQYYDLVASPIADNRIKFELKHWGRIPINLPNSDEERHVFMRSARSAGH